MLKGKMFKMTHKTINNLRNQHPIINLSKRDSKMNRDSILVSALQMTPTTNTETRKFNATF